MNAIKYTLYMYIMYICVYVYGTSAGKSNDCQ